MPCNTSCLMRHMEGLAASLSLCPTLQTLLEVEDEVEALARITVGPMDDPEDNDKYSVEELENLKSWVQIVPGAGGHIGVRRGDTTLMPDIQSSLEVMVFQQVRESEVSTSELRNETWKCFVDRVAVVMESELWEQSALYLNGFTMPTEPMYLKRTAETGQGERLSAWYRFSIGDIE